MIETLFAFIARLLATLLALVFVCATVLLLNLRSADAVLFDPLTYQLALAETNTWLKLPDLITAEVVHLRESEPGAGSDDLGATLYRSLEPQDLRNLARLLLPPTEVQRLAEDALEQGFAYLEMRQDQVVLDLTALKRNAAGKSGAQALEILAGGLPECGEPGCPSSTQVMAEFDPKALVAEVPDEYPLIEGAEDPDPREELAATRAALGFAPLVLVALLAVVCLFGARSRAGWLRWSGVPLLVAGLIAIGLGISVGPGADLGWAYLLDQVDDLPSPTTLAQLRAIFDAINAEHVRHLQFEGGAVALVGFALTLLSFFVPERRLAA